MDLKLPKEVGRYTLLRHLASGGMAEIYLATGVGAEGFGRTCAIKRIRPELAGEPRFRSNFVREAKLAASLHHPNIISVFDLVDDEQGELYLAMEYIDGVALSSLRALLPGRVLPVWAVARIGWSAARALDHAHQFPSPPGVIHRDVSPQNILAGKLGEVKLIDFGIARPANAPLSGGLAGKWAYTAPEQARGGAADQRSDLFGLGVTLFELLTGDRPYRGRTDAEILDELRTGSTPPPLATELRPDVPAALSDLIDQLVQRRPDDRLPSAHALAEGLEAILSSDASHGARDLERLIQQAVGPPDAALTPESPMARPVSPPTPILPARASGRSRPTRIALGLSVAAAASLWSIERWKAPPPSIRASGLQSTPTEIAPAQRPLSTPAARETSAPAPTRAAPLSHAAATTVPVRLAAKPFAQVTVDGHPTADADPFVVVNLPRGKHRAVFTYEGEAKAVDFSVTGGGDERVDVSFAP